MKKEYLTILTNIIGGVESGGRHTEKENMVRMPEKQQMQTMKKRVH